MCILFINDRAISDSIEKCHKCLNDLKVMGANSKSNYFVLNFI